MERLKTIIRVDSNNTNIFKIKIAITKLTSNSHNESDWSIEKILSKEGNTKPPSEPTRVAEQTIFIIDPNGLCQNFIALPVSVIVVNNLRCDYSYNHVCHP